MATFRQIHDDGSRTGGPVCAGLFQQVGAEP